MSKPATVIGWGAILMLSTVAVGVVHGRLTNRWGPQPNMIGGARQLEKVPEIVGDWRTIRNDKLDPEVVKILQCEGQLNRTYENTRTGQRLTVFVILGPTGPTAAHTPDICYSSRDYRISRERQLWSVELPDKSSHQFWDLRLEANDLAGSPLRSIYAWTNSNTWQAPTSPRFKFGGSPYLYKIQIAGPPPSDNEQGEPDDACQDFLLNFLPQLQQRLIES